MVLIFISLILKEVLFYIWVGFTYMHLKLLLV